MSATEEAVATYEFDEDFQTKIAALTLRDTVFVSRAGALIRPEYFVNEHEAALVRIGCDYARTYKKAPDRSLWGTLIKDALKAKTLRRDLAEGVVESAKELLKADLTDRDFVMEKVSIFARNQAVANALMRGVDHHEKGDFEKIAKEMQDALLVGIAEDSGEYDYAGEIESRTEIRKEKAAGTYAYDGISTGYPEIDKLLHHRGWGRKELSALMAPAKGGKSMGLADFAMNAWLAGRHVLYLTLEVSKEITSDRMDANLSDTMMKELHLKPFEVQKKIEAAKAKAGIMKIHEYASGTLKPSQLRALLQRYRARGIVFDLICVDYADIMAPEHRSDSNIENSKSIWLDLRAIAFEEDAAMLTATQSTRDGAKKAVVEGTDVAEDYNKIRIADIVLTINATLEEKAAGECRLFWAVVRNGEDGFALRLKQDRSRMKFIKTILGRE